MTYRKLTNDEILEIANRIKHADRIDFDDIRDGVKKLFGETAHKATLRFESEYNDEGYDLRPNEIKVWDAAGKRLRRPAAEDDYDEQLYDFFGEIELGECGDDDSLGDVVVFINETAGLDLPNLYIQEA